MNRLIIIGNGFDLAHGLKTSYCDFIHDYLLTNFRNAKNTRHYEDALIKVELAHGYLGTRLDFNENSPLSDFTFCIKDTSLGYKLIIKSKFLRQLLHKAGLENWVDIENEYYTELKKCLEAGSIDELNRDLGLIIQELSKYLTKLPNAPFIRDFKEILKSSFDRKDVVLSCLDFTNSVKQIQILNFNYTSTVEQYFGEFPVGNQKIDINYIHGKLNDSKNSLIFGFGDELDDYYKKLEGDKRKGFLHYIKSFWYAKTSNYHNLIRFIDSGEFQVFIWGHSCGLSDRTMLNMIFEHDNCLSIKIFYHGTKEKNNHTELTQEISRHFHNKGLMRKKIVPEDKCEPMPQANGV